MERSQVLKVIFLDVNIKRNATLVLPPFSFINRVLVLVLILRLVWVTHINIVFERTNSTFFYTKKQLCLINKLKLGKSIPLFLYIYHYQELFLRPVRKLLLQVSSKDRFNFYVKWDGGWRNVSFMTYVVDLIITLVSQLLS